jgi:hypothetical protein
VLQYRYEQMLRLNDIGIEVTGDTFGLVKYVRRCWREWQLFHR